MYRFGTGSPVELLDIGVFIDRVPPGCSLLSEALNVTQTYGRSPRHDDLGGGNGLEDRRHRAGSRRSDYGEWKRTGSANTLEERQRPSTANALEERQRASSTDALEVNRQSAAVKH